MIGLVATSKPSLHRKLFERTLLLDFEMDEINSATDKLRTLVSKRWRRSYAFPPQTSK